MIALLACMIVNEACVVSCCVHTAHACVCARALQAVEAKERVPIKQETLPTASITFQVFFK